MNKMNKMKKKFRQSKNDNVLQIIIIVTIIINQKKQLEFIRITQIGGDNVENTKSSNICSDSSQ